MLRVQGITWINAGISRMGKYILMKESPYNVDFSRVVFVFQKELQTSPNSDKKKRFQKRTSTANAAIKQIVVPNVNVQYSVEADTANCMYLGEKKEITKKPSEGSEGF